MRVIVALVALSLAVPFSASARQATPTVDVAVAKEAASTITPDEILSTIRVLAADSVGGRDTPSPGLEMSASWIARRLSELGLEPGGDAGGYVQRYEMHGRDGAGPVQVPNVVGLLRGSDPELRDEWVVFSAHFDHVSGEPDAAGDSIYNGADDNASGTAAILEVAEAFVALPTPPRRSLAFVLVSGEEKGLLGAAHFAGGASIPKSHQVADINADMVSRNAEDGIFVHGGELTSMGATLERIIAAHPEVGISIMEDQWPQLPLIQMSDQFAFMKEGTPGIFFFSGLHDDLHHPSDEVESVNPEKAARVARLIFYLGYQVAQDEKPPEWTEAGRAFLAQGGAGSG